MTMRYAALMILVLALPASFNGCGLLTPCSEEERNVEVQWGSIGEGFAEAELDRLRDRGWDCNRDGNIRNAFGTVIGVRYRCTRCR